MIHLVHACAALLAVVCPLRLPIILALIAKLDPARLHSARGFLGLRDRSGVRPSRAPMGDHGHQAQIVEKEERYSAPSRQRDPYNINFTIKCFTNSIERGIFTRA